MGLLYALTLLLNALLLFLVQPMIAKLLLPYLGGTPAVWNTCMVFFQVMLLGGYGYSHLVTRKLAPKPQLLVHLSLFVVAALLLPFGVSSNAVQALSAGAAPIGWLLGQLLLMVGMPFLMLATSGPLLQQWFSETDHPDAKDPYFLYSASNIGSLVALLGYPLLLEPTLRLRQQSTLWTACYGGLLVLLGACAVLRWRMINLVTTAPSVAENTSANQPLSWSQRGGWVLLAFVPSSLMMGVTTHLSTDISPFPLLWVLPLSLYLLTFILAFAKRQWVSTASLGQTLLVLGVAMIAGLFTVVKFSLVIAVGLPLLYFFCAAWLCHQQLAETRPTTAHLTEFYLWLSVGGTLGGLFNGLLAPSLFYGVIEYPLMVVVAVLMIPRQNQPLAPLRRLWERGLYFALPAALGLLTFILTSSLPNLGVPKIPSAAFAMGLPAVLGLGLLNKPMRFGLAILAIAASSRSNFNGETLYQTRNFFGVQRVALDPNGRLHQLSHGSTRHGMQLLDPLRQCEPLSYYHRNGPVGQMMMAFEPQAAVTSKVAAVGLGAGTLACYAKPGQHWTFYEIDPGVIQIATTTGHFTYLKNCSSAPYKVVLGDARLQLQKEPDQQFDLIVLDAFSSDAVPTHLLTKEAMELYLSKLAPGGRLMMHISNIYLDLGPVVAALAQQSGLVAWINDNTRLQMASPGEFQGPTIWVALARQEAGLGALTQHPQWRLLDGPTRLWTDDYSNIISVFKRR